MGNCWPSRVPAMGNCWPFATKPSSPVHNYKEDALKKSNRKNSSSLAAGGGGGVQNEPPSGQIITPNLKIFTYAELKSATRNFRPDAVLGEGGFGRVFKGWVDEKTYAPSKAGVGMAIAVKKCIPDSSQGLKEWQAEVKFLGKYSHPNLVKLLGYCCEDKQFLLVYECMLKGSLESHLFRKRAEPIPWETRMKIALGAARGLAFLHTSEKQVIYRNFKPSNILLDGDFNAKLSDFGLAMLGPVNGDSHVTTIVVGTYGYAAPEYIATGHLYVKSDVYGFGVVLLEILTGLKVIDKNRTNRQHNLVDWARPFLPNKRKLKKIMDPRLLNQYPSEAAFRVAQLILKCLESDPKNRPSMEQVLETLQQINAVKMKPKEVEGSAKQAAAQHHRQCGGSGLIITPNLKVFTYAELKSATMNFGQDTVLREGGFGRVFKGWVDEKHYAPSKAGVGMAVAVEKSIPDSSQGFKEWQSVVNFLGKCSHPNLVKLLGYCWEDNQFLLVYEYMQKGSLESHLFRRHRCILCERFGGGAGAAEPIPWETRMKIAMGAARGLAFLHTTEKQVIYRDFKASNILLDGYFNAKVSDFGLAKLGPVNGKSHETTSVIGTKGYAAPEYVSTGHWYVSSDVYGFGVVLLEILTGLKVLDPERPNGQHNLVDWARPFLPDKRKLKKIIDPRLGDQYPSTAAIQAAQLILKCLESDHKNRPSMEQVSETLQQVNAIKMKPKEARSIAKYTRAGANFLGCCVSKSPDSLVSSHSQPLNH